MKNTLFLIVVLLGAAAIFVSYRYSKDVYSFYLRAYYQGYRHYSEEFMIREGRKLMKTEDAAALKSYTSKLLVLYPHNEEAMFMAGVALLRAGVIERGLELTVAGSGGRNLAPSLVEETVESLFTDRYYGEVIALLQGRKSPGPQTSYYLARSYYETGNFPAALERFDESARMGKSDWELYYYRSFCFDRLTRTGEALASMKRARELNPRDPRVLEALADLYRRTGDQAEAEKIVRRNRR